MSDDTGATAPAAPSAATGASSPSATAGTAPQAVSSASTIETPASSTPAQTPASTEPGPIPYARFKEVNDALKTAKAFQDQHGWVEQFQSDPMPFMEQWLDQLAGDANYSPKLLAKAARMLQSQRGKGAALAASEEPPADVPIMDASGNVVNQTYSATQLKAWHEWNQAKREAALSERLGPLEQAQREAQHERQMASIQQAAQRSATETLTELRQQTHFTEHEAEIKQALIDHPEWGDNVHRAYTHVLHTVVLPGLSLKEQGKVLSHLQTQAAGASVRPGQAGAVTTPKFKSHREAMEYYSTHPEEAEAMANSR